MPILVDNRNGGKMLWLKTGKTSEGGCGVNLGADLGMAA
jgi:hypothetical protein